jgi:hypothetical protein
MVKLNDLQKHELRDWSDEIEEILRTLSEKAQIWRLLHMRNHDIFKRKYYWLIIPVTILSSITGAANLALGSVANGNETVINLVIGALGIIISVISTLNNIFSFQRRKDEHFRAAKDWYRVQRMIDIELSLQKSKRNNVSVFFHLVLQEIERIHEFHPNIRDDVVKKFMKSYKNKKLSIDIPEILTIRKTLIFKEDISVPSENTPVQSFGTHVPQQGFGNMPQHIINNPKINIHKKPSINRQGTFISMDDNSDKTDSSESSEHSLLNTDTHNTPESPKRKPSNETGRFSFLYNNGTNLNNLKEIANKSIENLKETANKSIENIKNIRNIRNNNTEEKHNNSPEISITILDKSINNELEEQYPFQIHHDNLEKINENDNIYNTSDNLEESIGQQVEDIQNENGNENGNENDNKV